MNKDLFSYELIVAASFYSLFYGNTNEFEVNRLPRYADCAISVVALTKPSSWQEVSFLSSLIQAKRKLAKELLQRSETCRNEPVVCQQLSDASLLLTEESEELMSLF